MCESRCEACQQGSPATLPTQSLPTESLLRTFRYPRPGRPECEMLPPPQPEPRQSPWYGAHPPRTARHPSLNSSSFPPMCDARRHHHEPSYIGTLLDGSPGQSGTNGSRIYEFPDRPTLAEDSAERSHKPEWAPTKHVFVTPVAQLLQRTTDEFKSGKQVQPIQVIP